jgi:predicted nucleotidyltransferase
VERVAAKIAPIADEVVFIGAAVAEFYVTRPVSETVRATEDTDVLTGIRTYTEYHERLGPSLRRLGFRQESGDPAYRWRDDDDVLDVLTAEDVHGFTNRWYSSGWRAAVEYELGSDLAIRILPPVHYLATKIEAHLDRGEDDPYGSPDFEDIVYVLANRPEIFAEIRDEPGGIGDWVADRLRQLFPAASAAEYLTANLRTGSTGDIVRELTAKLADLVPGMEE